MPKRPLIFPFGGRSDSEALYTQPGFSTKSARNVRGRDPTNGRIRGAQRAGMSKFCETQLGSGKVKALVSTAIDDRKITYAYTPGAETVPWSTATPSNTDSLGVVTDRQGNAYALDGNAGIAKYNSAGKLLMKVALPVADTGHIVRALFVDDSDRIFAAVSAGGDFKTARVFCVLQRPQPGVVSPDDANQYFVLWQFAPGAYTEELKVYRGSQLYCAHNYPDEVRARVIVYDGLGIEPAETKRIESVAYPIHGMDIGPDGAIYCASGPTVPITWVNQRPGPTTLFTPPLVGWKPTDDSTLKIWSWHDASEIDETDLEQLGDTPTLDDGQQILRWRDKSGNGRHWYAGSLVGGATERGPEYLKRGLGGLPNVRFDTGRTATTLHSLVSLPNASIDLNLANQQRTPIPAYTGSMWCLFMVLRPSPDSDAVTPSPRTILALQNEVAGVNDHVLFANRDSKAFPLPGTVDAGFLSYAADLTSGGSGTAGQLMGFDYIADSTLNHKTGAALVAILWDGHIEPGDFTKTRVAMRFNGRPYDIADGTAFASTKEQWLGLAPAAIFATGLAAARRFRGEIAEMIVLERRDRNSLTEPKVLTYDQFELGFAAGTDNQMSRIEAYLAFKWGIGNLLEVRNFYGRSVTSVSGILSGPPAPVDGGIFAAHQGLLRPDGLISKHDAQGHLRWTASAASVGSTADTVGGIGYGVRTRKIDSDSKTHVWSVGGDSLSNPTSGSNIGGNVAVRKLIDLGDTFSSSSADGAWVHKLTSNRTYDYLYPRMAADIFGNLYLPHFETGAAAEWSILVFQKDGSGGLAQVLVDFLLSASQQAHAVAIPPDALNPDYRTDLATKLAELVYIATRNESVAANPTIHKLLLVVTTSDASGSPRTIVTIGVVEDDIKTVTALAVATPTGGSGAIDSTSQYVEAFQADREIVVMDGLAYKVYSPLAGLVTALEATSAGEIPPRGKIGCMWRHRLVIGRFADKPGRYCASAVGNIRDWDFRREPRLSTMAFDASLTRAGEVEDSIVALMPLSDDLLMVFGESRILRLTGDPQAGGQIDKLTDDMGGTFGRSWCKDQSGRAFFFGNPPGLYMTDGVNITPLTRDTIEDTEFAEIDYSTHRIELAWDPIQKGVHILRVPHGAGGMLKTGWFWEEKTHRLVQGGAIWTDSYAIPGSQPTAATFLAGDSTRTLLIGCEDGFVRMVDPDAADDDGSAIDSYVVMGPLNEVGALLESRLTSTQVVLADDQQGCRLELFASEEAESIGPILAQTDLSPGLNDPFRGRVRGNYLWARLRSALAGRRWALERGEVEIAAQSGQQNRTT